MVILPFLPAVVYMQLPHTFVAFTHVRACILYYAPAVVAFWLVGCCRYGSGSWLPFHVHALRYRYLYHTTRLTLPLRLPLLVTTFYVLRCTVLWLHIYTRLPFCLHAGYVYRLRLHGYVRGWLPVTAHAHTHTFTAVHLRATATFFTVIPLDYAVTVTWFTVPTRLPLFTWLPAGYGSPPHTHVTVRSRHRLRRRRLVVATHTRCRAVAGCTHFTAFAHTHRTRACGLQVLTVRTGSFWFLPPTVRYRTHVHLVAFSPGLPTRCTRSLAVIPRSRLRSAVHTAAICTLHTPLVTLPRWLRYGSPHCVRLFWFSYTPHIPAFWFSLHALRSLHAHVTGSYLPPPRTPFTCGCRTVVPFTHAPLRLRLTQVYTTRICALYRVYRGSTHTLCPLRGLRLHFTVRGSLPLRYLFLPARYTRSACMHLPAVLTFCGLLLVFYALPGYALFTAAVRYRSTFTTRIRFTFAVYRFDAHTRAWLRTPFWVCCRTHWVTVRGSHCVLCRGYTRTRVGSRILRFVTVTAVLLHYRLHTAPLPLICYRVALRCYLRLGYTRFALPATHGLPHAPFCRTVGLRAFTCLRLRLVLRSRFWFCTRFPVTVCYRMQLLRSTLVSSGSRLHTCSLPFYAFILRYLLPLPSRLIARLCVLPDGLHTTRSAVWFTFCGYRFGFVYTFHGWLRLDLLRALPVGLRYHGSACRFWIAVAVAYAVVAVAPQCGYLCLCLHTLHTLPVTFGCGSGYTGLPFGWFCHVPRCRSHLVTVRLHGYARCVLPVPVHYYSRFPRLPGCTRSYTGYRYVRTFTTRTLQHGCSYAVLALYHSFTVTVTHHVLPACGSYAVYGLFNACRTVALPARVPRTRLHAFCTYGSCYTTVIYLHTHPHALQFVLVYLVRRAAVMRYHTAAFTAIFVTVVGSMVRTPGYAHAHIRLFAAPFTVACCRLVGFILRRTYVYFAFAVTHTVVCRRCWIFARFTVRYNVHTLLLRLLG